MKRVIAAILIAAQLAGCTINLGYTSREGTSLTQTDHELALMNCKQEAEVAWSGGHGFVAELMIMSLVGIWPAVVWHNNVKRNAFRRCMESRGFRVLAA